MTFQLMVIHMEGVGMATHMVGDIVMVEKPKVMATLIMETPTVMRENPSKVGIIILIIFIFCSESTYLL